MKLHRSMLFVPGNRETWVAKALNAGADAIILDLEDSVPAGEKSAARLSAAHSIRALKDAEISVFVRVNALETGLSSLDLEAVVTAGLDGVFLPKVETAADIWKVDAWLSHFELKQGIEPDTVKVFGWPETAQGIMNAYDLVRCCPQRMAGMVNVAGGQAGDVARAIGYRRTQGASEIGHLLSHVLLANRAAGITYPLSAGILEISNLDAVRHQMILLRDMGYRGAIVIHPSAVPIANEVFAPTTAEIAWHKGVLAAMAAAETQGAASANYDGMMIDFAHAKNAREVLAQAQSFGLDIDAAE